MVCPSRLRTSPKCRAAVQVLWLLRFTGLFLALCFLLAELENAAVADCGGTFLAGWRCGSPASCEAWKSGLLAADVPAVDRSRCWSWIDTVYYAVVTYVTIGYGDVAPLTKGGKLIAAFLVTLGLLAFTVLLSELNDLQNAKRLGADKTLRERLEELHEVIDQDEDGTVSPEEYILFNLQKMGKVDKETLSLLRQQFEALDADSSGELDRADVELLSKICDDVEAEQQGGAGGGATGSSARQPNAKVGPAAGSPTNTSPSTSTRPSPALGGASTPAYPHPMVV